MGYTHYFDQQKPATQEQWEAICKTFQEFRTLALVIGKPFPIQLHDDDQASPEISADRIIFNGIGDDGHESMVLEREADGFQFCKTARKPYDQAVMVLLTLCDHYAPDTWEIGSDGGPEDWRSTIDWMNTLELAYFDMPILEEEA